MNYTLAIGVDKTIVSVERHGNSAWSSTMRVTARSSDGTTHDYFAKAAIPVINYDREVSS